MLAHEILPKLERSVLSGVLGVQCHSKRRSKSSAREGRQLTDEKKRWRYVTSVYDRMVYGFIERGGTRSSYWFDSTNNRFDSYR
jgi:hypothetical protein